MAGILYVELLSAQEVARQLEAAGGVAGRGLIELPA